METTLKNKRSRTIDVSTFDKFELSDYLGVWYDIARHDHRFEKGLSDINAQYIIQDNVMINVVNSGFDKKSDRRKEVVGKAKTTDVPGLLRVSFFWIFYSDYRVLCLGDNYEWALVSAGSSDKYLWILSRTEKLPEETLKSILSEAERRGFDTSKLMFG